MLHLCRRYLLHSEGKASAAADSASSSDNGCKDEQKRQNPLMLSRRAALRLCCGLCGTAFSIPAAVAESDPSSGLLDSCMTSGGPPSNLDARPADGLYLEVCKPHIDVLRDILLVSPEIKIVFPSKANDDSYDLKIFAKGAGADQREAIFIGCNLINEQSEYIYGDIVLGSLIAHECGHILQFKSGRHPPRIGKDKPDSSFELEADFIAGYYIGVLRQHNKFDFQSFLAYLGDKDDVPDEDILIHGSIEERTESIRRGFSAGFAEGRLQPGGLLHNASLEIHDIKSH